MNAAYSTRITKLQERCEQQRQQLAVAVAGIEARLHTADRIAATVRDSIRSPQWWLAAIAGWWFLKRARIGWLFGRGWLLWLSVRRVIRWFRS